MTVGVVNLYTGSVHGEIINAFERWFTTTENVSTSVYAVWLSVGDPSEEVEVVAGKINDRTTVHRATVHSDFRPDLGDASVTKDKRGAQGLALKSVPVLTVEPTIAILETWHEDNARVAYAGSDTLTFFQSQSEWFLAEYMTAVFSGKASYVSM